MGYVQKLWKLRLTPSIKSLSINPHSLSLQPLYGFTSADYVPFRNASGGGRDLHFTDDKELDLDDITAKQLPKLPIQMSLKGELDFCMP